MLIFSLTGCKTTTGCKAVIPKSAAKNNNSADVTPVNAKSSGVPKYSDKKYKWISSNKTYDKLKTIQDLVDNGHTPKYLIPQETAMDFIFEDLHLTAPFNRIEKEESADNKAVIYTFHLNDGRLLQLFLDQPVKQGSGGIWYVEKYRFIKK